MDAALPSDLSGHEFFPMAPTDLPEGMELQSSSDSGPETTDDEDSVFHTALYGDPALENPFADLDLVVTTSVTPGMPPTGDGVAAEISLFGGESVDIAGTEANLSDSPLGIGARLVSWSPERGVRVEVQSVNMDDEELLEVATSLEVDGDGEFTVEELPSGLERLDEGDAVGQLRRSRRPHALLRRLGS